MLRLLLDEHISPRVAAGLRRRIRALTVYPLKDWEEGAFLGQDDASCLMEAAAQGLTFVTYDRRTIPPLLKTWAEQGIHHAGVIFVDERTISPADIGGLVRAVAELAKTGRSWAWQDRICYLRQ